MGVHYFFYQSCLVYGRLYTNMSLEDEMTIWSGKKFLRPKTFTATLVNYSL